MVAEPSPAYHGLQFHETFGTYGYLMKLRAETLRDLGACDESVQRVPVPAGTRDAVAADGASRGRMPSAVANFLASHDLVSNVTYRRPRRRAAIEPLVDKYLPRGAGAVFSFEVQRRPLRRSGLHPGRDAVVAPARTWATRRA